jgi:hypothetical protein
MRKVDQTARARRVVITYRSEMRDGYIVANTQFDHIKNVVIKHTTENQRMRSLQTEARYHGKYYKR